MCEELDCPLEYCGLQETVSALGDMYGDTHRLGHGD